MEYFDMESTVSLTESFPRSKFYSRGKILLVIALMFIFGIGLIVISVKLNNFSKELEKISTKLINITIEFENFKTKGEPNNISNIIFDLENTDIAKNISTN